MPLCSFIVFYSLICNLSSPTDLTRSLEVHAEDRWNSFSQLLCICMHMKICQCGQLPAPGELPSQPAPVWEEGRQLWGSSRLHLPPAPPPSQSHCKHVMDKLHASKWHYVNSLMCVSFFHTMIQDRLAALIIIFRLSWPTYTQVWGFVLEQSPGFEKPISLHSWHLCKVSRKKSQIWVEILAGQWRRGWPRDF